MALISSAVTSNATYAPLTPAVLTVYSKEILFYAQPNLRFAAFAVQKTDLTITPGLTIKFMKYNNLSRGGTLVEGTDMVTQPLSALQVSITVAEQGNAVQLTELLVRSSFADTMADASRLLGYDMAIVLDYQLAAAALGTPNVEFAPDGTTPVTVRTGLAAGSTFGTTVVKNAVETLSTNKATKLGGDYYVCFVHPHQGRTMRDDTAWTDVNKYANAILIYNGEIGKYEGVRFIETTMMPIIKTTGSVFVDSVDTGVTTTPNATFDVYQAVMFGENAFGHAISLPVELRDNGVQDFRRKRSLAWYGIWGTARITDENLVRIESI